MSALANPSSPLHDCRDAFAAALESVAERDPRVVIVANDSIGSSKLTSFRKRWPERTINVGIAEQNMVGVGAGLANAGKIPFVSAASSFLTARALGDQGRHRLHQRQREAGRPVAGHRYGELGPTHHSIEDFAWLRVLSNLAIVSPADPWEQRRGGEGRRSS